MRCIRITTRAAERTTSRPTTSRPSTTCARFTIAGSTVAASGSQSPAKHASTSLISSSSEAFSMQSWARQANAQGITWFAASGDSGGTDCAYGSTKNSTLTVDLPAALPEVTGVGGTTFNEGSASFWNATADANRASAL